MNDANFSSFPAVAEAATLEAGAPGTNLTPFLPEPQSLKDTTCFPLRIWKPLLTPLTDMWKSSLTRKA